LFKKSNFDGAEKTIKKNYRFLPFKFIANVIVHLPELTCLMNTVVFNLFFQSSSWNSFVFKFYPCVCYWFFFSVYSCRFRLLDINWKLNYWIVEWNRIYTYNIQNNYQIKNKKIFFILVDKDSIYEFVIHVVFLPYVSILNFIYLMSLNLRNKRQIIKKKD
jgi:hypothetical protein